MSLLKAFLMVMFFAAAITPAVANRMRCRTEGEVTAFYADRYNATIIGKLGGEQLTIFMYKFSEMLGKPIHYASEYAVFYNVPDKGVYRIIGFKDGCYSGGKGIVRPDMYRQIMQTIVANNPT